MADVKEVVDTVVVPKGCTTHEHHTLVERASVVQSLANLRTFPWVSALETKGELSLHGAWFDVALGELHVFDESKGEWALVQSDQ
jgi:carbonic anhydrase